MIRVTKTAIPKDTAITREELVSIFVDRLARAVESVIGIQTAQRIIKKKFQPNQIIFNMDGTLEYESEAPAKEAIKAFIEKLTTDFGYEFSESILEEIFTSLTKQYPGTSTVSTLLNIVPEKSLEKERVQSLSRKDLETRAFLRTKELEELNARLEKTVVERTKELVKANETLEAANRKLEELSRAKTEFLSFASHQLKAPLTTIKWASQVLKDETSDEDPKGPKRKSIDAISVSADRMVSLISDLLNIARIEEGRFEYEFKPVSVTEILQKTMATLRDFSEKKSVPIITHLLSEDPLHRVRADASKIALVFENILSNAIKYTPNGETVEITTEIESPHFCIRFKDHGIGIPKEEVEKIATKFFRATNAKNKIEGTGLGLYLAKRIIEDHHGKLEIESEEGKGTTMSVLLPLQR